MSSSTEQARCRATLKGGSRSFHLAAGMLPPRVREPAAVLYAFCREADDLVDQGGGVSALRVLHGRLARLESAAGPPGDLLLAGMLQRHHIPVALLEGLLDGFAWDVEGRQYADAPGLLDYAMRVAGTVGLAMALVMGARGQRALVAASALGIAMQLTNICRDVAEDSRLGRVYLPLDWLSAAGLDAQEWLLDPQPHPAVSRVVGRVLALADACYAVADGGLPLLPRDCQPGIRAARRLYAGIGHRLRRLGADPMAGRTVVPAWEKLRCLVLPERPAVHPADLVAAQQACEFAARSFLDRLPAALQTVQGWQELPGGRVQWVLELFERLERRARQASVP